MYSYCLRLGRSPGAVSSNSPPSFLKSFFGQVIDRLQLHTEISFWEFDQVSQEAVSILLALSASVGCIEALPRLTLRHIHISAMSVTRDSQCQGIIHKAQTSYILSKLSLFNL